MNITTLGVDLAKNVFEICGVNSRGKILLKKRLRRNQLVEFISNHPKTTIAMEACSGANHWARKFTEFEHEVKLIAPQFVKPFVKGNKNDEQDAFAITEAACRNNMRFVAIKTLEQQDWQSLLRARENIVTMRTKLCNNIRGLVAEYGVVGAKGIQRLRTQLPKWIDSEINNGITPMMKTILAQQYEMLLNFDTQIKSYDTKLKQLAKNSDVCKRLMTIPGVGPIVSVNLAIALGNGSQFKNGRHFAAFLGLVPRQHSSGGRDRLLGISKRGDKKLRSLLVQGASACLLHRNKKQNNRNRWLLGLSSRMHRNKVCIALANKNARIALAILRSGENYRDIILKRDSCYA